jgi:thiamine pyrophosphate-dependent acetolactate synthase large subunit-like protein
MRHYTGTATGNQSVSLTHPSGLNPSGTIGDIHISGTATSVDVVITAGGRTIFSATGINPSTAGGLHYDIDSTETKKNLADGPLVMTTSSANSGSATTIASLGVL